MSQRLLLSDPPPVSFTFESTGADHIDTGTIVPGEPTTYLGYKQLHDSLGLPKAAETWGDSLKVQGLADLAYWVRDQKLPGITGLVVDTKSWEPGPGYFDVYNPVGDQYAWWEEQIRASLIQNWQQFLPPAPPPPTRIAIDIHEPPGRIESTIYRILRDSELARRIKQTNGYQCQLCPNTILLRNGDLYAEAHHIQPLGVPHNGPDIAENILCLCPNCHVKLDCGAILLSRDQITIRRGHAVEDLFITYHNAKIYGA